MISKSLEPFIVPMVAMAESQFPRVCGNCRRPYRDFRQFVRETKPVGSPTFEFGRPLDPIGMMSWTNCGCGSTLVLSCSGPHEAHDRFERALQAESQASGRSIEDLLLDLRAEVRRRLLAGD